MVGKADFISQLKKPIEELEYKNGYLSEKCKENEVDAYNSALLKNGYNSSMQNTQSCKIN